MGNSHKKAYYENIIIEQNKLIKILRKITKQNINKIYKNTETQTENIDINYKNIEIQTDVINNIYNNTDEKIIEINNNFHVQCCNYDNHVQEKINTYINHGKKWIDNDTQKLIEMYLQETDIDTMIKYFGRTENALKSQLRHIIYLEYIKCKDKLYIQNKYNITNNQLDNIIQKCGKKY